MTASLIPDHPGTDWQPMSTAPKDGTKIVLRMRHTNYAYCQSDRERVQWQQDVDAYWTDFNSGGWVRHGMAGTPIAWKPLPSPTPKEQP